MLLDLSIYDNFISGIPFFVPVSCCVRLKVFSQSHLSTEQAGDDQRNNIHCVLYDLNLNYLNESCCGKINLMS